MGIQRGEEERSTCAVSVWTAVLKEADRECKGLPDRQSLLSQSCP